MTSKEQYIRKILEVGCNVDRNKTIGVYSLCSLDNVRDIFEQLKEEYQIKQLIFLERDYKKIYEFLKTNPTEEEMRAFIEKQPVIEDKKKTKIIANNKADYDGWALKLTKEFKEPFRQFRKIEAEVNKDFFDVYGNRECLCVVTFPDAVWAEHVLGSADKEEELWDLVNQTILDPKQYREYVRKMKEVTTYLQKSGIRRLHFYTKLGTDFRIALKKQSVWASEPEKIKGRNSFFNFPSYEVFTSPNCYSAEGKIVMAKKTNFYGEETTRGEFVFERGKCIHCDTDSKYFNKSVRSKTNHLDRIGEIALVPADTPIAQMDQVFQSTLLDENAGCHFAFGHALEPCINIPQELLEKNGKKYYKFNDSKWHFDVVFGDESTTVEGEISPKKKVLIMENGKWTI